MINLILAGQLLGTAFACGLNLYATVALLGIAIRLDWIAALPPGLGGLSNGVVIGSALALYVVELVVDRVPYAGTTWEAVHTLIRPAAAAALAVLALQGMPLELQLAGAVAAAAMALAAHGSKAGLRLVLMTRQQPRPFMQVLLSLFEDALAIGIAAAALLYPETALLIVAGSSAVLLLTGPWLWRAALLGLHAVLARLRGFFGRPGWRTREQLPRSLRHAVPAEPLGRGPARATAATIAGLRAVGSYRNGWLIMTCDGPVFVYRSLFRSRCTPLPRIAETRLRVGLVTDALYVRAASANGAKNLPAFTIFLLKDGPPPHVTAAELVREPS
jgi:hypothetical protein